MTIMAGKGRKDLCIGCRKETASLPVNFCRKRGSWSIISRWIGNMA